MNKLEFRLKDFLKDRRLSTSELANLLGVTRFGIEKMAQRGTIKVATLRRLESSFGDCSKYIKDESKATESVIQGQLRA